MLETKSTVYKHTKGNTLYLTIPSHMSMDSAFPFKKGDKVTIEIYDELSIIVYKRSKVSSPSEDKKKPEQGSRI